MCLVPHHIPRSRVAGSAGAILTVAILAGPRTNRDTTLLGLRSAFLNES